MIDNRCTENCPEGTFEEGGICKLVEDIVEDIDLCANNYCGEHGTCSMKGKNVECECDDDYTGLTCNNILAEGPQLIKDLSNELFGESKDIEISKNEPFGKIKSLTKLIKEANGNNIGLNTEQSFKNIKGKTLTLLGETTNRHKNIIHLVGLTLVLEVKKLLTIRKSSSERLLQQIDGTEESISEIIKNSNEYMGQLGLNKLKDNQQDSVFYADYSNYLSYQVYTNDANSVNSNYKDVIFNKGSLVDLSQCLEGSDKKYVVITEIQQELTTILDNDDSTSNKLILGLLQDGQTATAIPECGYTVKIPFSGGINEELYKFYRQRGIDIYNSNDSAFSEPCYFNDKFDYDLTQKYRKNQLFQNKQIAPTTNNDDCIYQDLDLETNLVSFSCSEYNGNNLPGYYLEPYTIPKSNHVDNLPTKCGSKIDDIDDNIAFWLFLILFVIFIVVDSVLAVLSLKGKVSEKALKNDELLNDDYSQAKSTEAVKPEDIKPQINKSFGEIIKNNFFALHPVLSLFYSSIITPIPLTLAIFIYTIFNLFGFNALYFNETMIEDRIYDSFRNNFAYPMKTEFEKIMSSIATSIALNIIVRLICLVTLSQKEQLNEALKNNKKEMREEVNKFSIGFLPRRIIAGVFMLALSVFFYYYCVVFCGIYIKTQYGWFYSGVWSLLWNWIIYAPIYILIISLVENSGKAGCAYYMKKLFIF